MPVLPEPVGKIEHILIPTDEEDLNARVYTPDGDGPFPVIVYFHGGGWVIANLDVYEPSCRALCNAAEAIVVSVAYRQSPEVKYPAAVNDAYAATQWVLQNAAQIGDARRVAIAGESAGGNLTAVTCLKVRDEGGQMPIVQLMIYPVTDTSMSQHSYNEMTSEKLPLHSSMMPWFWNYYLGESQPQTDDPYIAPLRAKDLSGLPLAIVITAENDPLRDEGEQYAERLAEAGVSVNAKRFDGVTHEFFGLAGAVGNAKDAVEFAAEGLKKVWETAASSSRAG